MLPSSFSCSSLHVLDLFSFPCSYLVEYMDMDVYGGVCGWIGRHINNLLLFHSGSVTTKCFRFSSSIQCQSLEVVTVVIHMQIVHL